MECQTLIENVMEHLIGCPIEMRHSDNFMQRKTWYFKGNDPKSRQHKGCFGYVTGFHGMTEAQQRGALHFHVLLHGSLTPKLLELAAGTPILQEEVSSAIDSMHSAEIPMSFHVRNYMSKSMKTNHRKGLKENCKFPKFPPKATQVPPMPGAGNSERWEIFFWETVLETGMHVHSFTCGKPPGGVHGCRGGRPCECVACTEAMQLLVETVLLDNESPDPPRDTKGRFQKREEKVVHIHRDIEPPFTSKSQDYSVDPVRPLDERIVVWELKRPLLEQLPAIPISETLLSKVLKDPTQKHEDDREELEEAKRFCMEQLDVAVRPGNPEEVPAAMNRWLRNLEPSFVIGLYHDFNEQIVDGNGFVTETNPLIANATGSSTNAILLGNSQQSRASLFCITSCITKNKMSLEHCLSALCRAQAHIEKFPSKAEDSGTKKRTIQHLMERVLNTLFCHRELSDTQVALALLNGLGAEATSDSFGYYGAGYMANFIDAELCHNTAETASQVKLEEDTTDTGDASSMSTDSSAGEVVSPSDN